jgi:hypothetical protein
LEKAQTRVVTMAGGLTGHSYEERLVDLNMVRLEEGRHTLDMLQTYKIVSGKKVKRETWFRMAKEGVRATCTGD